MKTYNYSVDLNNDLRKSYCKTHQHIIVILDPAWSGSPGAEPIAQQVKHHCISAGWTTQGREPIGASSARNQD